MIKGLSKAVSQTARVKAAKNVMDSPKRGFKFTVEGRVADAAPAAAATSREYPVIDHDYDACVVGAGGAGLRAAFGLVQEGFKTAVITKVFTNWFLEQNNFYNSHIFYEQICNVKIIKISAFPNKITYSSCTRRH